LVDEAVRWHEAAGSDAGGYGSVVDILYSLAMTMTATIPVAILGPTGYTGLELLDLLTRHPQLKPVYLATARERQPRIDHEFPRLAGRLPHGVSPQCQPIDAAAMVKAGVQLAFLCLPHEAAMHHAPLLLAAGIKVVDLSAAYRLKDAEVYANHYGHAHTDGANLAQAVYGLCELNRGTIKRAKLVANPGCYPTAAALGLVPLLRRGMIRPGSIIVNAASGASGAGREAKPNLTIVEAGDNYSAYGIGVHRHQPEIEQSLRVFGALPNGGMDRPGVERSGETPAVLFVPHLLPVERGILETIYAEPISDQVTTADVQAALRDRFADEPFVCVREESPTLRDVQHTNRVHLNGRVVGAGGTRRVVIVAAIDNLVKGASGQAIQNANLMLGLEEGQGLT
jgi:N-acetyl-gamma-glutamyl-phosphate reductase